MSLTSEELEKINDLDELIYLVENLLKILYQYDCEKDILIEILYEKVLVMKSRFNLLIELLFKN